MEGKLQEGSLPSGWPSLGTAPPVAGLAQKGTRTATACSDARLLWQGSIGTVSHWWGTYIAVDALLDSKLQHQDIKGLAQDTHHHGF